MVHTSVNHIASVVQLCPLSPKFVGLVMYLDDGRERV